MAVRPRQPNDEAMPNPARESLRRRDQFKADLQAGLHPTIEEALVGLPNPEANDLTRQLLTLEIAFRIEAGETLNREDYLRRFCDFHALIDNLLPASAPEHSLPLAVTLTVIAGPHTGKEITFTTADRFLVGRSSDAHFCLDSGQSEDRSVSRQHFLLEVDPPLCRVYDLKSCNGTRVNGRPVESADLEDGDEIQAGHTILRVSIRQDEGAPSTFGPAPMAMSQAPAQMPTPKASMIRPLAGATIAAVCCVACGKRDLVSGELLCRACQTGAEALPQTLPGYFLLRELGRGAMGVVHLAARLSDGELLAVKRVTQRAAPCASSIQRFLREAELLRQLEHRYIVGFRESGTAEHQLYLATEYVAGTDAARLLQKHGHLEVAPAVRLGCQLLQALEYAHERGVVHRDIKPSNLLLERLEDRLRVKVADFGLARIYQASQVSDLTLSRDFGGTAGYMPPEQITSFRTVLPSADQYSTAATLYHLLTGFMVYDLPGGICDQLAMILAEKPVPIRERRSSIPGGLAKVIHRALARDPAQRFPDAAAFREALLPFAR